MITDAILDVVFGIIKTILEALPVYDFAHKGAFQDLFNALNQINEYFPVDTLAECAVAYFAFSATLLILKPVLKISHTT